MSGERTTNCPRCGSEISLYDGECPHCGEDVSYAMAMTAALLVAALGIVVTWQIHRFGVILVAFGALYFLVSFGLSRLQNLDRG